MSEAPERVWLTHPWQMSLVSKKRTVEYVRADKLEELAAENERLRRELSATTAERKRAQEACQQISEKAEAALAEKDKEIAALHSLVRQAKGWVADHERRWHENADQTLARNAGGKDEPCRGCGDGDKVPASGYWRCPVCDAEWSGEDAE